MSEEEAVLLEVVIAAFRGDHWLVVGEAHLPSLLEPDSQDSFAVSFVDCETWAQVIALWQSEDEDERAIRMPWSIHPSVARQLRRRFTLDDDDEGWNLNLK